MYVVDMKVRKTLEREKALIEERWSLIETCKPSIMWDLEWIQGGTDQSEVKVRADHKHL